MSTTNKRLEQELRGLPPGATIERVRAGEGAYQELLQAHPGGLLSIYRTDGYGGSATTNNVRIELWPGMPPDEFAIDWGCEQEMGQ